MITDEFKIRLAALGMIARVRVETRGVGQIIPGSDTASHHRVVGGRGQIAPTQQFSARVLAD